MRRQMTRVEWNPDPKNNVLLGMLEVADYQSLMEKSKVVSLKLGKRIYSHDEPVDNIYFPISCMISLLVTSAGKFPQLELATVGREGAIGAIEAIHSQGAMGISLVQIPGAAVRTPTAAFLSELRGRLRMEKSLNYHLHFLARQILQVAACNYSHNMKERCARWILTSHDRAGQDTFPLTQEFLSHMLGVRRATVNEAVGLLRKAGLITFVRGRLTLLNRKGLESAACACYQAVRKTYIVHGDA